MSKPLQIIIGVVIALLAIYFLFSLFVPSNEKLTCECYYVVGDEDNFVCFTPDGEIDTEGECVGQKIYK